MRLEVGHIIRTNYDTGPFRIQSILRGCTCTHILDSIESRELPLPPHTHLVLRYITRDHNEGKEGYIGYLDEETMHTYGEGGVLINDEIILCENDAPVQATLA